MIGKNKLFFLGIALGFALAFVALWFVNSQSRPLTTPSSTTAEAGADTGSNFVDADSLRRFLQAADADDFSTMASVGRELFAPGKSIPGNARGIAAYLVNSEPPYRVYAFHTGGDEEVARRILLTLDDDDAVVSFLAEEMPVL